MLFIQLLDREGEIGVGERLILQGEVPPLGVERLKAVAHHSLTQDHAVLELFGGDAAFRSGRALAVITSVLTRFRITAEVGVALGTEPVEGAAHIDFLLRRHVEQRQVKGRATRMTALQTDVVLREEHAFDKVRIEVGLHKRVDYILCPAYEMVNTLLRTVCIVDLYAIALGLHIIAHSFQAVCSLLGKQCYRRFVAVDARTHEIVCAKITDL